MRIAVCLSGELGDWKSKYENWKNLFFKITNSSKYFNTNSTFDIFVHTWDFNLGIDGNPLNIDSTNFIDFNNFIRPIDIKIDNYTKYLNRSSIVDELHQQYYTNTNTECLLKNKAAELYSIMMASHLKRNYEINNNFEYDVCFGLSTNTIIDENIISTIIDRFTIPNDRVIYPANVVKTFEFPYDVVNYDLFFTNSQTFDVICSMYNHLPMLKKEQYPVDVSINYMFGYFLRMFDMDIRRLNINTNNKNTI